MTEPDEFQKLLDKSSLGSPGAKALIARADPEQVKRVIARSRELFIFTEDQRRELTLMIKANPNNFDPVFDWIETTVNYAKNH